MAAGLWAVVVAGRTIASGHPGAVERCTHGVSIRWWRGSSPFATGWMPFSLAEVVVLAGILALVLGAAYVLVRARWRRWSAAGGVTGAARVLALAAIAVLVFDVLWGFNYDRAPVAVLLRYDLAPAPPEDLAALSADLLERGGRAARRTAGGWRRRLRLCGRPARCASFARGRGYEAAEVALPSPRAAPVRSPEARRCSRR